MDEIKSENSGVEVVVEQNIAKISVVGIGMTNQSGVTGKLFRLLADNGLEFKQVFTSELSISFIVDDKYKQSFIELVGDEFDLIVY